MRPTPTLPILPAICLALAMALGPVLGPLAGSTPGAGELAAQTSSGVRDSTLTAPARMPVRATNPGDVEAQVFLSALQAIARMHQTPFSDSTLWAEALDGLIASLDDPYASVFTPDEVEAFEEENTGNYAGIGVQITELNDVVTITAVFRSTPADQAGVQVGDVIVGVNAHDASEWNSDMVADSVRGPVGTPVEVRVRRAGYDTPITFPIVRAEVHRPAVTADYLSDGILYVAMDRVARGVAQEMDSVLRQYRGASGIVVDLRRNPGGYLDESLMLADLFLEPGRRLASTRSRDPGGSPSYQEESWNARMRPRVPGTPIVILVDEFTASAAEILAGALQDYDRALILGQRTFGKGVVQTVLELPHGRRLRLTTGAWYTPLGRSLHRTRDETGRPEEEIPVDSLPTVNSAAGRELIAAGGIFPDVTVPYDTLTLRERELLQSAAEDQIPLPLRIAEFGFSEAQALDSAGEDPRLREAAFQGFLGSLAEEGVRADLLDDPEVQRYLRWRVRIAVADRMDRLGDSARFRMERDAVLGQAVDLLRSHPTQTDLFTAAAQLAVPDGPVAPRGPVGQAGGGG
ncbi:MAG: S41 family peptidase [Longimicrobiales bacterium]|nr:S41 family peptidase [Longimicrobiales bacterium]